jgi:hypothetical protein
MSFSQENDMSFPEIRNISDWKEIKHRVDLISVASELLGDPEKVIGDQNFWFCPFCHGTEPCLRILKGNSRFRCVGCQRNGDAIDLLRAALNVSLTKALQFLSSKPEFFNLEEGEIRAESSSTDEPTDSIVPHEYIGDDDWISDLLRNT